MVELDLLVLRGQLGDRLTPEAGGLHHVRLVDRRQATLSLAGGLEGDAGNPLDLLDRVRAVVMGTVPIAAGIAEVDAARQLADDEQVRSLDALAPQRAGVEQRLARADRPQVREQA